MCPQPPELVQSWPLKRLGGPPGLGCPHGPGGHSSVLRPDVQASLS